MNNAYDRGTPRASPFSLLLPSELADALRERAQAHDRSQGAEVRHFLKAHLAARDSARTDTQETPA